MTRHEPHRCVHNQLVDETWDEWMDFLQLWWEAYRSRPVTSASLLGVLHQSRLANRLLGSSPRKTVSNLNRLIWRNIDLEQDEFCVRLVDLTVTGYPRQYTLDHREIAR